MYRCKSIQYLFDMKEVQICFEFKGGKGYADVSIVPLIDLSYRQSASGCKKVELKKGDYTILIDGVSPAGGTKITVELPDDEIIKRQVNGAGPFERLIDISIS